MTTDLTEDLDRVAALTKGHDLQWPYVSEVALKASATLKELEAEVELLRGTVDYILDGMGIADPDYDIDPDDDFLDAANSEWVRDTLTRLAAAMKEAT